MGWRRGTASPLPPHACWDTLEHPVVLRRDTDSSGSDGVKTRRPLGKIKVEPPQHHKNRREDKEAGTAEAPLKTMIFF